MFNLALGIFLISLIILIADIFIEGFGPLAILAIAGIVASMIITAFFVPDIRGIGGGVVVLAKLGFMGLLAYPVYRGFRKRMMGGSLVMTETLAEDKKPTAEDFSHLLDKEGITKTALRPFGKAEIEGEFVEVWSNTNYIAVNEKVKVVEIKDAKVFVKQI